MVVVYTDASILPKTEPNTMRHCAIGQTGWRMYDVVWCGVKWDMSETHIWPLVNKWLAIK